MILLPALRLATGPFPPRFLAARFLAAVIRPPLLFFAISMTSFFFAGWQASILPNRRESHASTVDGAGPFLLRRWGAAGG